MTNEELDEYQDNIRREKIGFPLKNKIIKNKKTSNIKIKSLIGIV
jgi:hypothetical protein